MASRCQLAHDLFNYLAPRHRMNPADLWIRPFPIYQKTIKVSLYVSGAPQDAPCGPWWRLSDGRQQVGGRTAADSQVHYVLKSRIMKDFL